MRQKFINECEESAEYVFLLLLTGKCGMHRAHFWWIYEQCLSVSVICLAKGQLHVY